ncbi:Putative cysteine-rich receptor-like protein kinase 39 [Triticum urartu]|uniref:non-specific serine/threonine protein kinase n=1 Tax=Triticum urartu TaxID=4572 RepID=M7ZCT7_TRIUA|nr:Putative cysteine-rich receptor-like protein kinase 39 [Triticum urartu]
MQHRPDAAHAGRHGGLSLRCALGKGPNVPSASQQLDPCSDGVQNCGASAGTKNNRDRERIDSAKGNGVYPLNVDESKFENVKRDIAWSKIKEITENDRLYDAEAAEKLVQLLQLDRTEQKIGLAGRARVADIIAATENPDFLGRFIQLRGLPILNEWLQQIHKGKSAEGGGPKETDKPIEELIHALLRALVKLPINLNALQSCSIGKTVNHLRSHKDQEIQRNARCLVDSWKKRVDAEMKSNEFKRVDTAATPAKRKFSPPKQSNYNLSFAPYWGPHHIRKLAKTRSPISKAYDIGKHDDGQSILSLKSINNFLSSSATADQLTELKALQSVLMDANAEPTKLSFPFIRYITQKFRQEIGRGGFGVVYLIFNKLSKQGDIGTGKVAVKKLSIMQNFSEATFLDEINCLIKAKHTNIVRFLGYCADTYGECVQYEGSLVLSEVPQRLLCFEYVPNGNLQKYLEDKSHKDEWKIRYQMIRGICNGLNYLHDQRITHLDLKPGNILLDARMDPKITDFGISRCFDEGITRIYTKNVRGTRGIIAPETIVHGEITFKSDIYGLGNIIIHLLAGCNNYDFDNVLRSIQGFNSDDYGSRTLVDKDFPIVLDKIMPTLIWDRGQPGITGLFWRR